MVNQYASTATRNKLVRLPNDGTSTFDRRKWNNHWIGKGIQRQLIVVDDRMRGAHDVDSLSQYCSELIEPEFSATSINPMATPKTATTETVTPIARLLLSIKVFD
jgi:hypothetical protein